MGGVSGAGWRYNRYGLYHRFHRRWRRCSERLQTAYRPWRSGGAYRAYACRSTRPSLRLWTHRLRGSDCFWSRHCSGSAGELAGADAKTIFTRAGQGDEQAQRLIHRSARTLARLIADIKATTDCQCVVVGGSVGLAEGYLALVETYLAQEPAAFHVDLLAAHYRHDAGLLGAALLAQGEKL